MALRKSASILLLGLAGVHANEDDAGTYHEGNAVVNRNMPPMEGCTVTGKIFKPLTPVPEGTLQPFLQRVGWDWCQDSCKRGTVTDLYGSVYPCQHFAFYPDGKCFLGGINAVLEDDDVCNSTNPCEHGFQVISGPPDCRNKTNWVFPPAAVAAETSAAPETAPAPETSAAPETTVAPESTAAPVTSAAPTEAATAAAPATTASAPAPTTAAALSTAEPLTTQQPPSSENGPKDVAIDGPTDVAIALPVTVVAKATTIAPPVTPTAPPTVNVTMPPTVAPVAIETTTVPPPPQNATVEGYYYEPHNMPGTARVVQPNWQACHQLCESNVFCQHFGYWPDGGCHQQGNNVTLVKASAGCQNLTDCPGLQVITGPRDLSDASTWPSVDLGSMAQTTAAPATVAPAPATVVDDSTAKDVSAGQPGDNEIELKQAAGGGGGGAMWLVGLLALLAIAGCAFAAYSMGLFGEGYKEYDDEDDDDDEEDPEDGEGSAQD